MRAPVAVEISERWLKIVVAKPSVRPARQPESIVKPIAGFTDAQITQAVAATFRELQLKAKPLTVCLPRNLVTVRNLHLPSQNPVEIAQMIDLNIIRIVPYRKEEVLSSYRLLGVDEIGYAKIMLAIVHRDLVKRHVNLLEAAGLFVERILLSSHGAWQWTTARHKAEVGAQDLFLLLDVDAAFTDLLLCSRDHLFFSRSIAIDSDQLAEEAGLSKLFSEVSQSLEIFQHEESNKRPAKAFISGAGIATATVKHVIGEGLKVPVAAVGGPPAGKGASGATIPYSLSAVAELASHDSPQALAFVLPEMQIKQALKDKTREIILAGTLSLYLLSVIAGLFMSRLYFQQAYLKNVRARNDAVKQEIGDLVAQAKRIEVVKDALRTRELPLRYLAELQRLVSKGIAIDFLSVDEQQRGVLRGQATQLSDVFTFVSALESSTYVGQVDTKYTRRKKVRDKELTEFELSLRVHL